MKPRNASSLTTDETSPIMMNSVVPTPKALTARASKATGKAPRRLDHGFGRFTRHGENRAGKNGTPGIYRVDDVVRGCLFRKQSLQLNAGRAIGLQTAHQGPHLDLHSQLNRGSIVEVQCYACVSRPRR